mmetsp:Transcript_20697/g.51027  ORF Transcript_20697/g.51027 Transcript_20697/m.51027 type:complete len:490 (-) Transcript_20697:764-2233(-)
MAACVNLFWGTAIVGGNTAVPNIPVDYLCINPYPSKKKNDPVRLQTDFLAGLIDEYGAENVMFLAKSVQHKDCPIRIHLNELTTVKDRDGSQKYNFDVKESIRGFEGRPDVKNKVRVETFCRAKGCEADCVVVFGFDVLDFKAPIASLNQMCVALSRARKRLIVIHEKISTEEENESGQKTRREITLNYYPVLGDSGCGTHELAHSVRCNGSEISLKIPPFTGITAAKKAHVLAARSILSEHALVHLKQQNFICGDPPREWQSKASKVILEGASGLVYDAKDFSFFSASEIGNFLQFGEWALEGHVNAGHPLEYNMNVNFVRTSEDVSAFYGEALNLMLQWSRNGYCPNVETVVSGVLWFNKFTLYDIDSVRKIITLKRDEALTVGHEELLSQAYGGQMKLSGSDLVPFINDRLRIRKKRIIETPAEVGTLIHRTIYFPMIAKLREDDDELMRRFLPEVEKFYVSNNKTIADWIYLSNAIMGFRGYHEK